jgi:hypothetical protein
MGFKRYEGIERMWDDRMTGLRTRAALIAVAGFSIMALSACALMPEGESVCPDRGPNTGSWPYCGSAPPGGPGPADDPINPRGGR